MLVAVSLSSCSWFKPKERIVYRKPEVIHPALPVPVMLDFDPSVALKVVDGKVITYMSFDDMLSLIRFNAEVENYIYNVNALLCFYRKDLKEDRCVLKTEITDQNKAIKNDKI